MIERALEKGSSTLNVHSRTSTKMHLSINKIRLSKCIARWIIVRVRAIVANVDQSKVRSALRGDAGCYGDVSGYPRRLSRICSVAYNDSDAH